MKILPTFSHFTSQIIYETKSKYTIYDVIGFEKECLLEMIWKFHRVMAYFDLVLRITCAVHQWKIASAFICNNLIDLRIPKNNQ